MQLPRCLEVIARDDLQRCPRWQVAFANERKDHRYYELVEDTLHPEFEYRYFVLKDTVGQVSAVQPFFLLNLDLLVGASPRYRVLIDVARWMWPRLMRARTLMVGCVAGEGHLDGDEACNWYLRWAVGFRDCRTGSQPGSAVNCFQGVPGAIPTSDRVSDWSGVHSHS